MKKKSVKSGYMMSSKKMGKNIQSAHCNSYEPEGDQIEEAEDLNAKNVEVMLRHDCASHVRHGEWGEGRCIPGEHTLIATGDGEGIVTHYDVMFEHGVENDVDIIDLEIVSEASHMHSSKMKKGKKVLMDKKKKKDDEDDNGDDNLDPVNPNALKGTHADRKDGDIDNDGDEDDSDEYLHKKRKAISKAMKGKKGIKEWVNFAQKRPGDGTIKNAMEANNLAQHYLQMAQRDKIFGRDASENEKLAKQFYEQYKEMKSAGDESDDDTFQNEKVVDALENIKEDVERTQVGSPQKIKPQYNTKTHKLVKRKGEKGLKTVPKDYKLRDGEYEAEEVQYEALQGDTKGGPGVGEKSHVTQAMHKKYGGRGGPGGSDPMHVGSHGGSHAHNIEPDDHNSDHNHYAIHHEKTGKTHEIKLPPKRVHRSDVHKQISKHGGSMQLANHVANDHNSMHEAMDSTNLGEHAPEVVEYTSHAYDYNRSSWMDALAEVNRYKGRSGHRVTKPEKEGPEHIVMQMRKVMSLGDNHQGVDFGDGTKKKVGKETAAKFLNKYNSSKPADKEKLQRSAAHSHGGLHHEISDKPIEKGPGQPQKPMFKPAARREPTRRLVHPDDRD